MSGDSSCSSHSASSSDVLITSDPVSSPSKKARLATSDQVLPASASGGLSGGGFQAAVLERLKCLCGEHDDAKVLAEYIVVMVAGNKGREDMASEMKPFFSDQAQADSFVEWVEECKWKFLTGGRSPLIPKANSPQQAKVTVSPQVHAEVSQVREAPPPLLKTVAAASPGKT